MSKLRASGSFFPHVLGRGAVVRSVRTPGAFIDARSPLVEAEAEAFAPIVETLLGRSLDSPEFADALICSTQADRDEAMRQIRQKIGWICEREDAIERRLDELADEYGFRRD